MARGGGRPVFRDGRAVTPRPMKAAGTLPAHEDATEHIRRIDSVIQNARPTWFAQLGAAVFAGITLLGVDDVDFFRAAASTKLPLVNVDVPVTYFFGAGAVVLTATYVYLHLYLELLWDALGRAPPRAGKDPVADRILPWQVAEWGLRKRDRLRKVRVDNERSAPKRGLSFIGDLTTVALVWLFGLVVIFAFWWRSMPAHIDWMSVLLGWLFAFALWAGWRSWRRASRLLAGHQTPPPLRLRLRWLRSLSHRWAPARNGAGSWLAKNPGAAATPSVAQLKPPAGRSAIGWFRQRPALFVTAFFLAAASTSAVSLVRTASDHWPAAWHKDFGSRGVADLVNDLRGMFDYLSIAAVARANLVEKHIARQPADWIGRSEAQKEYRAAWARREGLTYADPFPAIAAREPELDFQAALAAYRARASRTRNTVVMAEGRSPSEPDAGADLDPYEERSFRLSWAREEGLSFATPFPAIEHRVPDDQFGAAWRERRRTYLDVLDKPVLEGANLRGAQLSLAFMPGILLRRARLEGADLFGATLWEARLEDADLIEARLEGANLSGANLSDARLWDARLEGANLSGASLEGADLRGARLREARLEGAALEGADLFGAGLEGANLSGAGLESADLRGADLRGARLSGARLREARLEGADLSGARLFGTPMRSLDLNRTSLSASRWVNSALRHVVMLDVNMAELWGFETSFGDGSVKLPVGYPRPCQWAGEDEVLSDAQFFGRWRGWLDANGRFWPFDLPEFEAIPPPSDCRPIGRAVAEDEAAGREFPTDEAID